MEGGSRVPLATCDGPENRAPTNFSHCRVSYIMRTRAGGTLRLQSSILVTVLIALGCTGCIFISSTQTRTTAPPAVVYVPNSPTSRPALWADPEIEAAAALDFESSRVHALNAIAQRPGLCPQSQTLLVQNAYMRLDFESSKVLVIQTLIRNPDFSNAGKAAIVRGLHHFSFDSSRSLVLNDINNRGALPW